MPEAGLEEPRQLRNQQMDLPWLEAMLAELVVQEPASDQKDWPKQEAIGMERQELQSLPLLRKQYSSDFEYSERRDRQGY